MEETSGFEGQQLFLALIPFCILIYFDFYILGAFYVLFLSCLWEDTEDYTPEDNEVEISAFEDPEMEIDEFLLLQRLKDAANIDVIKEKQKFLITQITFENTNDYKIGCDILLKSQEINMYEYKNQKY